MREKLWNSRVIFRFIFLFIFIFFFYLFVKYVTNEKEVIDLLKLGEKFRSVSATQMNAVSSRSHRYATG
jgi:Kinesin motor domain